MTDWKTVFTKWTLKHRRRLIREKASEILSDGVERGTWELALMIHGGADEYAPMARRISDTLLEVAEYVNYAYRGEPERNVFGVLVRRWKWKMPK